MQELVLLCTIPDLQTVVGQSGLLFLLVQPGVENNLIKC